MKYSELYKNPNFTGTLGGVNAFLKNRRPENKSQAVGEIKSDPLYSKYFPARRNFKRRAFLFHYIDQVWVVDLKILDKYKRLKENKNKSAILMCLDGFSRYLFTQPVKNKTGPEVARAFEQILIDNKRIPKLVFSDRGLEFVGKEFQNVLKKYNIGYYNTYSTVKASVVERSIKTIFEKLARLWSFKKGVWLPYLEQITSQYNRNFNQAHKMRPVDVTKENENEVWFNLYKRIIERPPRIPMFEVGDVVRVALRRVGAWTKGYEQTFSDETFKIREVIHSRPVEVYRLTGLRGTFYREELIKIENGVSTQVEQ